MQAVEAKTASIAREAEPTAQFKDLPIEESFALWGPSADDPTYAKVNALLSLHGGKEVPDSRGASSGDNDVAGGPGCRCPAPGAIRARRAGGAGRRCGSSR